MTKYGLEYFAQRAEVLTEMARPSPLLKLGEHGHIAANIFSNIGNVMRKGGEIDGEMIPGMGGNREKNRQLRYFLYMMTGMDADETDEDVSDTEATYNIASAALNILGADKSEVGTGKKYSDVDKLYRAAILKGVDGQYRDYIMSPEFRAKTLDPKNILTYVTSNRVTNPYSQAKAAEREEAHGMSNEEIDAAETGIKDVITKIHRTIRARKLKKQPELAKEEESGSDEVSNDFIDNVYFAINAIENIEYYYDTIHQLVNQRKRLYEDPGDLLMSIVDDYPTMPPELIGTLFKAKNLSQPLRTMVDEYSQLKTSGIDLKTLYNQLESYKDKVDPEVIDAIVEEMDELISKSEEFDISSASAPKGGEEFPGYPQDVIDMFLTTPELKQQFAKFHKWKVNDMIAKANRVKIKIHSMKWGEEEIPGERDIVRKAAKDFFDKRPEVKKQDFNQNNEINKNLGPVQKNESYIMDYMTEQVSKDKFKPVGEFKDRGFKKASYHEWLLKNQ